MQPRKKMLGIVVSIIAAPFLLVVGLAVLLGLVMILVMIPVVFYKWTALVALIAVLWGAASRAIYEIFFDEDC